nr:GMP synthetase [Dictyostelium discoideum]
MTITSPVIKTPPLNSEIRLESNLTVESGDIEINEKDIVNASEVIVILDAGSQYSKVIDRRVRELNVASEIHPLNIDLLELIKIKSKSGSTIKGIIISGGPESVYGENAPKFDKSLFSEKLNLPIFGICYGMQLMNYIFGGKVESNSQREDGVHNIEILKDENQQLVSKLFKNLNQTEQVLLTHGDSVTKIADGFKIICKSDDGIVSGIENERLGYYGVQFHPEVDLTTNGKKMFSNFLIDICGCSANYTLDDREQQAITYIKSIVSNKKVLVLVSGGVDSTVCAALISKAIGPENVIALHIDNGFMRKDESLNVEKALSVLGLHLIVVDASQTFYNSTTTIKGHLTSSLKETISPEERRKIIGDTFMRVAENEVKKLGLQPEDVYLAQGTLRPDLIESSSKTVSGVADVIKTHHNDTELVRILRDSGRVVEPLKDYHKDEVRELGKSLGLSDSLVWRQPFPGPGLAIRIICADEPYLVNYDFTNNVVQYLVTGEASSELESEVKIKIDKQLTEMKCKRQDKITIKPVLLPIQTVVVQGDGRTYSYLLGLYSSENSTIDQIPWSYIFNLARTIPKICHNINRVVFIFSQNATKHTNIKVSNEPVKHITPTRLTPDVIKQLQHADSIVSEQLYKYNLIKSLSQVPVVSLPIDFGVTGNRSIAIRTFITNDFMTGVPAIPGKNISFDCLQEITNNILTSVNGISKVLFDCTSKPPGTTEFL